MAIKSYLQLVRLPNVFTAGADSLAGWLLVSGTFREPERWLPLVLASACTYAGGIVLNDVFDFEVDLVERPGRPLPSGRIERGTARFLGFGLLVAGLAFAVGSRTTHGWAVALGLIGCVLAYDAGLKRSPIGPEVMGACRGLNLLLGMSQIDRLGGPEAWLVATAYAVFVTGITWISRSEVAEGTRKNIAIGLVFQNVAFFGLIVACAESGTFPNPEPRSAGRVLLACAALASLGFIVQSRTIRALQTPKPELVQRAVKLGIMSLVWIHVGLLLGVRGIVPALVVALFWIPAASIGRWIYST